MITEWKNNTLYYQLGKRTFPIGKYETIGNEFASRVVCTGVRIHASEAEARKHLEMSIPEEPPCWSNNMAQFRIGEIVLARVEEIGGRCFAHIYSKNNGIGQAFASLQEAREFVEKELS